MDNSFLKNIFSAKIEGTHKVFNFFGIKFKFKSKILTLQKYVKKNIQKIQNSNKNLFNKIENNFNDKLDVILTKTIISNRLLFNCRTLLDEKYILTNSFFPYLSKNDIKDDYLNLIKGLDAESVLNIQKVLCRIKQLQKTNNNYYFLSNKELEELKDYTSNFSRTIVPLDKNVWAYKDYLLPSSLFDASIFYYGYHLNKFSNIDLSKDIIDAGASFGDSALYFSRLTSATIHSFEPTDKLFKMINRTIELNNLTNVKPVKMGLLDKKTTKEIFIVGKDGQSTTINTYRNDGSNSEMVQFTTIDDYVKQNNLKIGLIKVDVEGAERLLLTGAMETIKEQKPALIISIYHGAEDFFKIKVIIESLNLGYKFKVTQPSISNIVVETCLLAEIKEDNLDVY